jgi:Zn-dependent protease
MPSDANIHGFLLLAPVFIVSLTLHELAHALAAYRLGDRTAKDQGRLTLNPIAHMDPLGSLILVVTYFGGSFLFGWAKPVPVEPANLRTSPQVGMALVGAAGPATNFVLALISGGILAHNDLTGDTFQIVAYSLEINVILGVFNLFPIPPLDGSRVIGGFMPRDVYHRWTALDQYGMFAVFGLFFLFQKETSRILESGFEHVVRVISAVVGGHPLI